MSSSTAPAGTPPQPTPGHMPGTRGNLTPSQTRALFRLWSRFFRLCQEPAAHASAGPSSNAGSVRSSAGGKVAGGSTPHSVDSSVLESSSGFGTASGGVRAKTSGVSDSAQLAGKAASTHTRLDSGVSTSSGGVGGSKLGRRVSAGAPPTSLNGTSNPASSNGPHLGSKIPRDDGVKDELKTLEEAKEMKAFLDRYGGERLRTVFWEMVKGEHPDALMLRFLRARKWDVDRAIAVIGATAAFRIENDVEALVRGGELELCKTKGGRNIFQNGISYVYGASYTGEPIYFIEEWLSMLMPPPVEQKVVVFNLRNFGLRNMDWWTVFFMVKTMESYYVESLARVYVHCPPWIFRPIWAILRPLLDPVVRDKVRLTSTTEELADHIPWDHLPKDSMGGGADWGFSYPLPDAKENDLQLDTQTRDGLRASYSEIAMEFERFTARIIRRYQAKAASRSVADGFPASDVSDEDYVEDEDEEEDGSASFAADLKAQRDVLATRLRVAWLKLAPYVVGRSKYHRWGVVNDDGTVRWHYHTLEGKQEVQTFGEGTTLEALEAGLEQIEAAQKQAETAVATHDEPADSNGAAEPNGRHRRQRTGGTGTRALDEALGLDTGEEDTHLVEPAPATTSDHTDQTSSTARPLETASESSPVAPLKPLPTDGTQPTEPSPVEAVVPVHPLEASREA